MQTWLERIKRMKACEVAIKWAEQFDTIEEAWQACERGDWMLWLLGKTSGKPGSNKKRKLVLASCACARLSLPYVQEEETRPLKAIETAEAWARGEEGITLEVVRTAADAAYAAFAADAVTRTAILKRCADIVRQYYPSAPEAK